MDNESIHSRVLKILSDYDARDQAPGIDALTALVEDLGMDSLDVSAVRVAMEMEFDIEIPDDIMAGMFSAGELTVFIEDRLKAKNGQPH